MGAYSPPGLMDEALRNRVKQEILEPTLHGLIEEGIDYRGIVYAGLIITPTGPKVLEYNCRFGDPETQSLLPRLKSNLLDWLEAVTDGHLKEMGALEWDARPSVGVVLASGGYPGSYRKGLPVRGLENFNETTPDLFLFHAGTTLTENGEVLTNGGRVFNVIATDSSIAAARIRVYNMLDGGKLSFEDMLYRRDIAAREIKGEI
jgi:phosphoribosylamine--glycine ligase